MIQHINLVFQAGGLSVGEGAFLMACANHTDDKGYVIAHIRQIADEAHMSHRSAQDQKARLEKRGLLRSKDRFNPKNGAQVANLFRINLTMLAGMKRPKRDYGPSLVEELTFGPPQGQNEENPSSPPHADLAPPHADLAPPHADLAPPRGADLAPLLLPSPSPSSLSGLGSPSGDADPVGEREAATPEGHPSGTGAGTDADVVVDAYEAAAGRRLVKGTRAALRSQAVELLAAGRPVGWLAARAAEMPGHGWVNLIKHCERSRVPISGQNADGRERCPDHPARYRKGCMDCAMAVPA
ncbi:hypothetical protein ACFXPW_33415 [Streptomyces goshikiensis]|uniref:hypothetical protein n=1 Tax=Streptomyces goshikiensis TaxID=1942 RepID=UPI0036A130EF